MKRRHTLRSRMDGEILHVWNVIEIVCTYLILLSHTKQLPGLVNLVT